MPDKAATLGLVETEYQNLRQAIDGLEDDQLTNVWLDGWSIREIIGHVIGWERESIIRLERMARGERPTPEGVDYSNPDEWNVKFAREVAASSPQEVFEQWQQVHTDFVAAAMKVPDERYGEEKTVNWLLEGNGYGHYQEHTEQIRKWRQQENI